MNNTYAVILAGGSGERFWPLSTPECPKQFVSIFGGTSLIRMAADRLEGLLPPERILVITADKLVPLTRETLPHLPSENIIGEPCRRDTAPAVAVACGLVTRRGGPDAVACILTADHLMTKPDVFRQTLQDAVHVARTENGIVTMGIAPTYPATGFGYIESSEAITTDTPTPFHHVSHFVEKPDVETARAYLATGRYSWNAGMFIWKTSVMRAAFADHAPDMGFVCDAVVASSDVTATLATSYATLRAISIDYAVMEHAKHVFVATGDFGWDDVGTWTSMAAHFPKDAADNTCLGAVTAMDSARCILISDDTHRIATLGINDLIVVHTAQATLVCTKDKVQELKALVKSLT